MSKKIFFFILLVCFGCKKQPEYHPVTPCEKELVYDLVSRYSPSTDMTEEGEVLIALGGIIERLQNIEYRMGFELYAVYEEPPDKEDLRP